MVSYEQVRIRDLGCHDRKAQKDGCAASCKDDTVLYHDAVICKVETDPFTSAKTNLHAPNLNAKTTYN